MPFRLPDRPAAYARLALRAALACRAAPATSSRPSQPSFYQSMAQAGAQLDSAAAASMISGYRANNGLGAVTSIRN